MTDPMTIQHGGSHYKGLAIEPFEMSMANRYDGAIHSILKYVTRHGAKGGAEDLMKAHHIAAIRLKYVLLYGASPSHQNISMGAYVSANKVPNEEAEILMLAEDWSAFLHGHHGNLSRCDAIQRAIMNLISIRYPKG